MRLIRTMTILLTLLLCLVTGCRPVQGEIRTQRFSRIDRVIEEEIEKGNFPGAVVLLGRGDDILYWRAFGHEVTEPYQEPMGKNAVFDLASLTKPIATATSIMILRDRKGN